MVLRIFRHFVPVSLLLLGVSEFLVITIAWSWDLAGSALAAPNLGGVLQSPTLRLAILAGITMAIAGLYQSKALLDFRIMVVHLLVGLVFLTPIIIIGVLYWRDAFEPQDPLSFIYIKAALSWLVCILITRAGFLALVDLDVFKTRIIVLGAGHRAAHLADIVAGGYNRYFVPVGYIEIGAEPKLVAADIATIDSESPETLARIARARGAAEVVVATDDRRGLPVHQLLRCRLAGIRVIDYLDFIERETKSVDLDALSPGWLVYSDGFRCSALGRRCKRCFDILLSLCLLLGTLPLSLLTALVIKLESPGPVLYRQQRVGLGGRPFNLLKFRSMRQDAEKDSGPRWAMTKDPRVTRVGSIIRKFRIDELPQLINVLRGEMSFVGPRPERPEFVDQLAAQLPYYRERHCIKPGITGWAQVTYDYGGSIEGVRRKLAYDLYYVKNHGFFLDMIIILQTVRVVFWADGAR